MSGSPTAEGPEADGGAGTEVPARAGAGAQTGAAARAGSAAAVGADRGRADDRGTGVGAQAEPGGDVDVEAERAAGGGVGPEGGAVDGSDFDRVPTRARWFVGVLLVLLAVPGIIGFEAWPLTGWRLFSLSRDDSQTMWVVQAVADDGSSRPVDLEDLPLRYRHAEWPMAELPGASEERRQAVCEALLGAVVDVVPGTAAVEIVRDRQQLVKRDGEWTLTHDPEVVHTCTVPGSEPAGGEGRS